MVHIKNFKRICEKTVTKECAMPSESYLSILGQRLVGGAKSSSKAGLSPALKLDSKVWTQD